MAQGTDAHFMHSFSCPNCGAAIPGEGAPQRVLTCAYCGTSFRVPASLTPEPDLGDLLLGTDFRDPTLPGWLLSTPENVQFKPGPPPELWARFPASNYIHPVVRTSGFLGRVRCLALGSVLPGSVLSRSVPIALRIIVVLGILEIRPFPRQTPPQLIEATRHRNVTVLPQRIAS